MKINEIVDLFLTLENSNDLSYMDIFNINNSLGLYSDDESKDHNLYDRNTGEPYKFGELSDNNYTKEEIQILDIWVSICGEDNLRYTPFCDRAFLRTFLKDIPKEDQIKYVMNTNMYYGRDKDKADPNYVLITRRAVPTKEEKPEVFWTVDPISSLRRLKYEINGEQRIYSVIHVTTLGILNEHGHQDFDGFDGVTDGEVRTSCKPFPRDKILFVYKPIDEINELVNLLKNKEGSYAKFIAEMFERSKDRFKPEGYKNEFISGSDFDDSPSSLDDEWGFDQSDGWN